MTMRCTVCANDRARWINAQIDAGRQLRPIATEARVSYDALRRHVNSGHVKPASGTPTPPTNPNASPEELLREVLAMLRSEHPASHADVSRAEALRKAAESLSKIAPAAPAETMTVAELMTANGGIIGKVVEALFGRLEPYPLVREAALEDLRDAGVAERPDQSDTYYWRVIHPRHHGKAVAI